jgi:2-polyprenyl-6-methoxyphenol hydroxylase-like FAD-dependent oxidoreductase
VDDVIVVGGRCAGAPLAMLLARAGLKVRVIERSAQLSDVLSGHMIGSSGTTRLRAWGLLDAVLATGCPPVTGGTLWIAGEPVPEQQAADRQPGGEPAGTAPCPAVAPRRTVLDPLLLDAARQAGAAVDMGTAVRGLCNDGQRITGVMTDRGDFPARLVIGADGRNSRVARQVGADTYIDCRSATYSYYTYWRDTSIREVCAFLEQDCFIGMFPTNDDQALVFFQAPHARFAAARHDPAGHYLRILEARPAAMRLLAGGTQAEPVRGTGDMPTFFRTSAGPGWALAGDAGHHKDPLPARGISDAFRDADLIAAAVTAGWDGDLDQALAGYPVQRDAHARPLSSAIDVVTSGFGTLPVEALAAALTAMNALGSTLDQLTPAAG